MIDLYIHNEGGMDFLLGPGRRSALMTTQIHGPRSIISTHNPASRRQALEALVAAKQALNELDAHSPAAAGAQRAVVEAARRRLGNIYFD